MKKLSGIDDEEDTREPQIKSDRKALKLTEMLLDYSRYYGKEDLSG